MALSSSKKRCPRCGSDLSPAFPGCTTCGWSPGELPPPWTTCPACGFEIQSPAAQCPACAHSLDGRSITPGDRYGRTTLFDHFLVILLFISIVFSAAYYALQSGGMTQTYAVFLGLPLLIGVLTAYLSRPGTGLGNTMKITTLILCIVAPLLREGAICILMAAPIFYAIALLGYGIYAAISNIARPPGSRLRAVLLLPLVPVLWARLTATPTHLLSPRTMTVTSEAEVKAPPERAWDVLAQGDLVGKHFPLFLRLGFPLPKTLQRLPSGETHITFDPGSEPWPGTNVIVSRQTVNEDKRSLTFTIVDDGTKLKRWLIFKSTTLQVTKTGSGCQVKQTTVFQQRLQPGFYWNPLESFAVGQMHSYLLGRVAELAEKKR